MPLVPPPKKMSEMERSASPSLEEKEVKEEVKEEEVKKEEKEDTDVAETENGEEDGEEKEGEKKEDKKKEVVEYDEETMEAARSDMLLSRKEMETKEAALMMEFLEANGETPKKTEERLPMTQVRHEQWALAKSQHYALQLVMDFDSSKEDTPYEKKQRERLDRALVRMITGQKAAREARLKKLREAKTKPARAPKDQKEMAFEKKMNTKALEKRAKELAEAELAPVIAESEYSVDEEVALLTKRSKEIMAKLLLGETATEVM
jgi:hypothetical protein